MREFLSTLALLGLLLGWAGGLLLVVTSIPVIIEKLRGRARPPNRPKVIRPKVAGSRTARKAQA